MQIRGRGLWSYLLILWAGAAACELPAEMLDAAAELCAADRPVDAVLTYLRVLDEYPDTAESAQAWEEMTIISRAIMEGGYGSAAAVDYAERLPQWEECRSVKSKYLLAGVAYRAATIALANEDKSAADGWNRILVERVRWLMAEYPDDPLQSFIAPHLLEAGTQLGEADAARVEIRAITQTGSPTFLRLMCHSMMAQLLMRAGSWPLAGFHNAQVIELYEGRDMEAVLTDPSVYRGVKARYLSCYGIALYWVDRIDDAVPIFERIAVEFPDVTDMAEFGAYFDVRTFLEQFPGDVEGAVLMSQAFLARYPDGVLSADMRMTLARALIEIGAVEEGFDVLTELVDMNPNTGQSTKAFKILKVRESMDEVRSLLGAPDPTSSAI